MGLPTTTTAKRKNHGFKKMDPSILQDKQKLGFCIIYDTSIPS